MSESGLHFIDPPAPNDRIIAYEIAGKVTVDDMRAVVARVEEIASRGEKALIYQDVQDLGGVDIAAIAEKFKHMGTLWKGIEKAAVIGDSRWLEIYTRAVDPLTPQQIKHFPTTEKAAAFAWLAE